MRLIDADELLESIEETTWYHIFKGKLIQGANGETDIPLYKASDIYSALDAAPTVDAVSRALFEWIKWERDMAVSQLNDYGVQLGEKADCVRVVRCRDCVYYGGDTCWNEWFDGFCSYGKRRDGE